MIYYNDYETEPMEGRNPYRRCVGCKRSVPEINGRLEGHASYCPYRKKIEQQKEIDWLKFLINSIVDSLPEDRSWLDPDIEKAIRGIKYY